MAAENKGLTHKGEVETRDMALEAEGAKLKAKDMMRLLKNMYVKGLHGQRLKSGGNYHLRNGDGKDSSGGSILLISSNSSIKAIKEI